MNRRKFLTVSALAVLPGRSFSKTHHAEVPDWRALRELLTPFLLRGGDPEYRPKLRGVFSIDGWQVATNGRICVRLFNPQARRTDAAAPTAENLNWTGPWSQGFRIGPFPAEDEFTPCMICGKTGPYQFTETNWWCSYCEGTGIENLRSGKLPDEFGGTWLRMLYVHWIQQLPGVVWHAPGELHISNGHLALAPLHFSWQYGDGLVMPLQKPVQHFAELYEPDALLTAEWEEDPKR
jgi:hypothetical protein